jgi:long-chain acyl-CoA synthetase
MQYNKSVIYNAFADQVERNPKKTALIIGNTSVDYGALFQEVVNFEAALFLPTMKKAPIAVISENGFLFPVVALLASKLDITVVPVASGLRAKQLQRVIELAKPAVIVVTKSMAAMMQVLQQIPQRHFTIVQVESATDLRVTRVVEANRVSKIRCNKIFSGFVMNFTSGSTGTPKPVCVSQAAKLDRINAGTADLFGVTRDDITLVSTPQYHSLGFRQTLLPLVTGGTGVILSRFSVESWVDAIDSHKVTFAIGVASQLGQVVEHLDQAMASRLRSLVTLVSSSAPFSSQQREACRKKLPCRIFECYGASEIGIATTLEIRDQSGDQNSVGVAADYAEIRIFDRQDRSSQLAVGAIGEIGVKSRLAFSHYHGLPGVTAQSTVDGFFLTGDLGYLSEAGTLCLAGRANETIQNAGITVYPRDIEQSCTSIPGVREACAVGIVDALGHEKIGLLVVADDDVSNNDILRQLMRELAAWQMPSKISRSGAIPLTAIGKIDRMAVRTHMQG